MKNYFKFTFLAAMMVLFVGNINAQKKIKEGSIEYKITEIESDNPMASMMKGSIINVIFKGKLVKTEADMGMMKTQTIINADKKEGTLLMDMMGKKTAVPLDLAGQEEKMPAYEITYVKSDTKEIAGYKCTRANIKMDTGETMTLYVTNKITPEVTQLSQQFKNLEGFPLQYQMSQGGMKMTLKAMEVSSKTPDKSAFEVPSSYEKMTMEEFRNAMGGMGM